MFGADADLLSLPFAPDLIKNRLENLEADLFDRQQGERVFQNPASLCAVERDQSVRNRVNEMPESIVGREGLVIRGSDFDVRRGLIALPEEIDRLADVQPRTGLITKPGNRGDILVGVPALVASGAVRLRYAVATLPRAERVSRHPRALNDSEGVIYWLAGQTAEQTQITPPIRIIDRG